MIELAVRHEDRSVGPIVHVSDVQQLDPGPLAGEALERQLDLRKALELDLQAQAVVHARSLLRIPSSGGLHPQGVNLTLQGTTVGLVSRICG